MNELTFPSTASSTSLSAPLEHSPLSSSYRRHAITHPYNIALFTIAATSALATAHYGLLAFFLCAEAIWVLVAPASAWLRAWVFDEIAQDKERQEQKRRQRQKFQQLSASDKQRALDLRKTAAHLIDCIKQSTALSPQMKQKKESQLYELVEDFLDILLQRRYYQETLKQGTIGKFEDRLALIENLFRLWLEEMLISKNEAAIEGRLEELHREILAMKEAEEEIKLLP